MNYFDFNMTFKSLLSMHNMIKFLRLFVTYNNTVFNGFFFILNLFWRTMLWLLMTLFDIPYYGFLLYFFLILYFFFMSIWQTIPWLFMLFDILYYDFSDMPYAVLWVFQHIILKLMYDVSWHIILWLFLETTLWLFISLLTILWLFNIIDILQYVNVINIKT